MFTAYPTYSRYRALRLTKMTTTGEDVYAAQTMLEELGIPTGPLDGILGSATSKAIVEMQQMLGLETDGILGPASWSAGVDVLARYARDKHKVARGLLFGQLSHESGLRGGNYSPMRDDGSYDAGVAQRNTRFTPPREGFDVPKSIEALAANTRQYFDLFAGVETKRRWTLAAGAWNAPGFACWYAKKEGATKVKTGQTAKPGAKAAGLFDAYLASVTAYLKT